MRLINVLRAGALAITLAVNLLPGSPFVSVPSALAAGPNETCYVQRQNPYTGMIDLVPVPCDVIPYNNRSNDQSVPPAERKDPCATERAAFNSAQAEVERAEGALAKAQEEYDSAKGIRDKAVEERELAQLQKTSADENLVLAKEQLAKADAAYHEAVISARHTPPWPYEQTRIDRAADAQLAAMQKLNTAVGAVTTAENKLAAALTAEGTANQALSTASGVLGGARSDEAKALLAFYPAQRNLRACEARNTRPDASAA